MASRKRLRTEGSPSLNVVGNITSFSDLGVLVSCANVVSGLSNTGILSYTNGNAEVPQKILSTEDEISIGDICATQLKEEEIDDEDVMQESSAVQNFLQYRVINPRPKQNLELLENNKFTTATVATQSIGPAQLMNTGEVFYIKELPNSSVLKCAPNATNCNFAFNSSAKLESEVVVPTSSLRKVPCLISPKVAPDSDGDAAGAASTSVTVVDSHSKLSYLMEPYKKRDDKRRATHNEVERRRRNKINNWIFKLKELMPPDASPIVSLSSPAMCTTSTGITADQQILNDSSTASRTTANDSKSQILIKACEYIKAMQDELNSLRECLVENENLRLSNERLQSELDQLKNDRNNANNNENDTSDLMITSFVD